RDIAGRPAALLPQLLGGASGEAPSPAMALDQRRERTLAARLEHARQQGLVAMAEILDVLDIVFVGLWGIQNCCRHGGRPCASSFVRSDRFSRARAAS